MLLAVMTCNYQDGAILCNNAVEYFGMGADLEEGVRWSLS